MNGWKAGRTELGGLHHHGRLMIFTGGKRSSAVLAACEKRRSGLASSTTQGPGTKTESSILGMPNHQDPRAASLSAFAVWTVTACLLERCGRAGTGRSSARWQPPPFHSVPASKQRPSTRPRPIRKLPWESDGREFRKLSSQLLFQAPGLSMARAQSDVSHTPPALERLPSVKVIRLPW